MCQIINAEISRFINSINCNHMKYNLQLLRLAPCTKLSKFAS